MSYGVGFYFQQAETKADAFVFANQVVEAYRKCIRWAIKDNLYYCPTTHGNDKTVDPGYPFNLTCIEQRAERSWLDSLFKLSFTYWPKLGLVGLLGDRHPEEVTKLFSGYVYFQNSCDQDYDFQKWAGICPAFDAVVDLWGCYSGEELLHYYPNMQESLEECRADGGDEEEQFEYYRRKGVYDAIFDLLDLDTWLYQADKLPPNEVETEFTQFAVNVLRRYEETYEAETILHKIIKETLHKEL